VFTARYALSPYIKEMRFVFKALKKHSNSHYSFLYATRFDLVEAEQATFESKLLSSALESVKELGSSETPAPTRCDNPPACHLGVHCHEK
jgi:hypothetical protein